jgi:hypothetical protein
MTRYIILLATVAFALHSANAAPPIQAPPEPKDMKTIFNGKDLAGWSGDPRLWSVKNGAIRGETTATTKANGNTFIIWTEGRTKDFELRLSFRCNATNNSGIQYRSKHITSKVRNKWVVRGYQHEIRNQIKFPSVSGFIYDEGGLTGGRGRTCLVGEQATWGPKGKVVTGKLIDQAGWNTLFKLDKFNDVIIIAKGTHIRHYMNNRLILDFHDDPKRALLDGILAFQLHGGRPMFAEFKNVRIREIKMGN